MQVLSNAWTTMRLEKCPRCKQLQCPFIDIETPINAMERDSNTTPIFTEGLEHLMPLHLHQHSSNILVPTTVKVESSNIRMSNADISKLIRLMQHARYMKDILLIEKQNIQLYKDY